MIAEANHRVRIHIFIDTTTIMIRTTDIDYLVMEIAMLPMQKDISYYVRKTPSPIWHRYNYISGSK